MGFTEDFFNSHVFAKLLEQAKGTRTISQYSLDSGVSIAHISRLLRHLLTSPPTPATIDKLAQSAHNNISYRDLMAAAGYIIANKDHDYSYVDMDSTYNADCVAEDIAVYSPMHLDNKIQEIQGQYLSIILQTLNTSDYTWFIQKSQDTILSSNLTVDIDDGVYLKWFFYFNVDLREGAFHKKSLVPVYGQLTMKQYQATDKVILVVNNANFYQAILDNPPIAVNANIYVMLIDINKGTIVKEEHIIFLKNIEI